ncbi:MAG: DUF2867 domain-containing protein [Roseiarcus sp.]
MAVQTRAPATTTAPLLAGAGFADAYAVTVEGTALDAMAAAELVFSRSPRWIKALLAARNRLGAAIGLKGADDAAIFNGAPADNRRRVGVFPVVSETPNRVVLGFDDWHLDFRVVVDVSTPAADRQQVTATTLVRTDNLTGRAYLALIIPFHRLIVRTLLARAARPRV